MQLNKSQLQKKKFVSLTKPYLNSEETSTDKQNA